jgi:hypothetical protein
MANTISGGVEVARTGNRTTAANSEPSILSDNSNTGSEQAECLQILTDAILNCEHAGIDIKVRQWNGEKKPACYVLAIGVKMDNGILVPA